MASIFVHPIEKFRIAQPFYTEYLHCVDLMATKETDKQRSPTKMKNKQHKWHKQDSTSETEHFIRNPQSHSGHHLSLMSFSYWSPVINSSILNFVHFFFSFGVIWMFCPLWNCFESNYITFCCPKSTFLYSIASTYICDAFYCETNRIKWHPNVCHYKHSYQFNVCCCYLFYVCLYSPLSVCWCLCMFGFLSFSIYICLGKSENIADH